MTPLRQKMIKDMTARGLGRDQSASIQFPSGTTEPAAQPKKPYALLRST